MPTEAKITLADLRDTEGFSERSPESKARLRDMYFETQVPEFKDKPEEFKQKVLSRANDFLGIDTGPGRMSKIVAPSLLPALDTAQEANGRLAVSGFKGLIEGAPFVEPEMFLPPSVLEELDDQSFPEKVAGVAGFGVSFGPTFGAINAVGRPFATSLSVS